MCAAASQQQLMLTYVSPYRENTVHSLNFLKPPPDLIAGEEEYEIDQILRHRGTPRNCSFLIQWKGYSAEEDSWTPKANLSHAKEALQEYKVLHPLAFPPKIRVISRLQTGLPQPTTIPSQVLFSHPSPHCYRPRPSQTHQLPAPSQHWSQSTCSLVLQDRLLPLPRHLNNMPCSYSDEPEFFIK